MQLNVAVLYTYPVKDYQEFGREKSWSTPKGICSAFEAHSQVKELRSFPLPRENLLYGFLRLKELQDSGKFFPHIVMLMNSFPFPDTIWSKSFFPSASLVYEAGDEPQAHAFHQQLVRKSDLVLTPDFDCFQFYKTQLSCDILWTAHWADMRIFSPTAVADSRPNFDVVTSCGVRGEVTEVLTSKLGASFVNQTGLSGEKNAELYRNGKIVFQESKWKEITRRIFEGMACRKMVVTDRLPESKRLESLFVDGRDIILYSSKEEALDRIRYYLEHSEERERIAENGFNKVIAMHHTDKIVHDIISFHLSRRPC